MPSTPILRDYEHMGYHGDMFATKQPRSFKMVIAKAIVFPVMVVGGLFLGMTVAPMVMGTSTGEVATADAPAAHVPGQARMDRMLSSGECWTGGEGHPYPTRVWEVSPYGGSGDVQYTMAGKAQVDYYISDFSRIPDHAVAFCR